MQKLFLTLLTLLVLLNFVRAQPSRNPLASSEQHWGAMIDQLPIKADGSFVSVTSLAAPSAARKAYEKASREMGKKKPDPGKAATELEAAVTQYPSFAAAWYFLGGIRLVLNDADDARRAFENALSADPKFHYAYLPLIAIELSARRYAEAARLADSVLKLDYRLMKAHYYRALANGSLRRHDDARQSIQAIIGNGNNRQYPGVHAILAAIFLEEGNRQAAADEYKLFLDFDPDSPLAALAREYLAKWRASAQGPGR